MNVEHFIIKSFTISKEKSNSSVVLSFFKRPPSDLTINGIGDKLDCKKN